MKGCDRSRRRAQEGIAWPLYCPPFVVYASKGWQYDFSRCLVLLRSNANDVCPGVLHEDETIALEDGLQHLERGHVCQAKAHQWKRRQLHARVNLQVQVRLARQNPNDVR